MSVGTACGKIILFGEHAVVYGRPALAVPLPQLRARARVEDRTDVGILIQARNVGRTIHLNGKHDDDPLEVIVRRTLETLQVAGNLKIEIDSDIPLASGLGSGAAVSTAIVRAIAAHFERALSPNEISALVYETEKLYHGTPSGIDNTVIAYEQAIRFVRGEVSVSFQIAHPLTLAIANTGIASATFNTVGDVRRGWELDPARYESIFDQIAQVVRDSEAALASGENETLGELMNRNQLLLQELDVSSAEIERLIRAGMNAGALGGKLSGGGRGGNVIFYVGPEDADRLHKALLEAGAMSVIVTRVGEQN